MKLSHLSDKNWLLQRGKKGEKSEKKNSWRLKLLLPNFFIYHRTIEGYNLAV